MNQPLMSLILDSVIDNLKAEGLLRSTPRTHLLLGYSGGADSTALLFLLAEIRSQLPLDITAVYFNHGWRGTPPEELPLVHENCLKCDVPLVIVQADKTLPKTESAARQARYQQLTRLAKDIHADAILTAHHADDQIETLLFRIMRGTGIDGLSGIQKRLDLGAETGSNIPVLRPLLDIARKKILEYVHDQQLMYFNDPTNHENRLQRNKIRNEILPFLSQAFPQVKNSLFRLSLVVEGDLQIIEDSVQNIWHDVYGKDEAGPYLSAIRFNQLGLPYQRRLLKRFLAEQNLHVDFEKIEDILSFIRGEGRKNLDSSLKSLGNTEGGRSRFIALYKNRLRLINDPEREAVKTSACVPIPGHVQVAELDSTFYAQPWQEPEKVRISPIRSTDSQQVFVNLSSFADKPLELRTRRPGDRFQPMGMEAPLKLKKFLINRGVPRFERNSLKVLALANEVLWVPGLGISQKLKIKDKETPTHLLKLKKGLHPPEEWRVIEEAPDREELPPETSFFTEELATGADNE
jgi:tRNA(Ile)-lysidine synthase